MLVNLENQFIILFFFIFSIFSCDKEDTTIPSIIINKPLSNDSFQIPTNINIVGSSWDDNNIDRIEIDVVSENSATIIQKIELPTKTPTCLTFGGTDMQDLFVTSLRPKPINNREDGNLFKVRSSAKGHLQLLSEI